MTDNLPKNELNAEMSVLGCMLIDGSLAGPVLSAVSHEDFRNGRCQMIFQAIRRIFKAGQVVDPLSVCHELADLPDIRSDVLQLMEVTPTTVNVWEYVRIVKEESRLAQLRVLAAQLAESPNLDGARDVVAKMNELTISQRAVTRFAVKDVIQSFYNRHESGKSPEYIHWGIEKVDRLLALEKGDFVIVGGAPSSGKTALSLQFAWNISKKFRVGYYSLETSVEKMSDRSVAYLAKIGMKGIKQNALGTEQWSKFAGLPSQIAQCEIEFIQAAGFTVDDIQGDALANRYDVIFIDYLQLILTRERYHNRTEQVTAISIELHRMSQSKGIAVVALSQLSRDSLRDDAPGMHHLRESGQIEQDADAIMMLYKKGTETSPHLRGLRVVKNKEGEIGEIFLDFDGNTQTFTQSVENPRGQSASRMYASIGSAVKQQHRIRTQSPQPGFQELTEQVILPF